MTKKVVKMSLLSINPPPSLFYMIPLLIFDYLFRPAHLVLPTREVHFGNIVENSRFLSHKVVQQDLNLIQIMNNQMKCRTNLTNAMYTSMEHDRRMLTVKFPYRKIGKGFFRVY